jgi:hypothetical protein
MLKNIATSSVFALLFFVVVLPVGSVIRLLADPLKLRKRSHAASYFRLH